MFYIEPSPEELSRALDAWQWLPIQLKQPILVTAFGDIFFSAGDGIWFLDTLEGCLTKICDTKDELTSLLGTTEGENQYLFAGFVERAHREGMILNSGESYDFKLSPVIGGKIEYENVAPRNFVVAVNVAGQLHERIKGMPEGSKITGFTIAAGK